MSVFEIPDWGSLASIVRWIAGEDAEEWKQDDLREAVLPAGYTKALDEAPSLRQAWADHGPIKVAAYVALAQRGGWHDDERCTEPDEMTAVETWARKYAILLRHSLVDPASEEQIAEALATLAEVLGQDVGEKAAAFIIEIVSKAHLPVYLVNALFERVATTETGKIKPASFSRLLPDVQGKLNRVRMATDASLFVRELEAGLAYFREHLLASNQRPGFD